MIALVLHAHLPWVAEAAPWTDTERWFHEALWECYLPLFRWLRERAPKATLSVSPTLRAMLHDATLRARSREHFAVVAELNQRVAPNEALRDHYATRLEDAASELGGELPAHITTSLTHAFLPGLDPVDGIRPQIELASPGHALWLPECALSPAVERALVQADVAMTVVDEHALALAEPRVEGPRLVTPNGLVCLARSRSLGHRVWSSEVGFPGHPDYREFYRDVGFDQPPEVLEPLGARSMTGLKYHRITGAGLGNEALYEPHRAMARAALHAEELVDAIDGDAVLAFDAELFGHWWHEGLAFLDALVERVPLVGLDEMVTGRLPVARPAPSTWGRGGFGADWVNPKTAPWWRRIHRAHRELVAAVRRHRDLAGQRGMALDAAIEATLLAQASDWLFMLTHDRHAAYAETRLRGHLDEAARLLALADGAGAPVARRITRGIASHTLRASVRAPFPGSARTATSPPSTAATRHRRVRARLGLGPRRRRVVPGALESVSALHARRCRLQRLCQRRPR